MSCDHELDNNEWAHCKGKNAVIPSVFTQSKGGGGGLPGPHPKIGHSLRQAVTPFLL